MRTAVERRGFDTRGIALSASVLAPIAGAVGLGIEVFGLSGLMVGAGVQGTIVALSSLWSFVAPAVVICAVFISYMAVGDSVNLWCRRVCAGLAVVSLVLLIVCIVSLASASAEIADSVDRPESIVFFIGAIVATIVGALAGTVDPAGRQGGVSFTFVSGAVVAGALLVILVLAAAATSSMA